MRVFRRQLNFSIHQLGTKIFSFKSQKTIITRLRRTWLISTTNKKVNESPLSMIRLYILRTETVQSNQFQLPVPVDICLTHGKRTNLQTRNVIGN